MQRGYPSRIRRSPRLSDTKQDSAKNPIPHYLYVTQPDSCTHTCVGDRAFEQSHTGNCIHN